MNAARAHCERENSHLVGRVYFPRCESLLPEQNRKQCIHFPGKSVFAEGNGKQKAKSRALISTVFQNFVKSVNFVHLISSNLPFSSLHVFLDISHICIPTAQARHCSLSFLIQPFKV